MAAWRCRARSDRLRRAHQRSGSGARLEHQLRPGVITAFPTPAATAAVGDENVTVRQRPHPEYQPAGIQTGGFILYPSVTASSAYDDNIFAVQTRRPI